MEARGTFLVTGAMGCLGAWTIYHLLRQGRRVVSFDLSEDRRRLNLLLSPEEQEQVTFVKGDLTQGAEVRRVFEEQGVGHVIHYAALQIPFCRADPALGAQVNVTGTANIFEAARAAGVPHVAYASSIAVFGLPGEYPPGPLATDAAPAPRTHYGVYKVANEQQARVYWHEAGISSAALRPYTVYGVGRDQGLTSDPTKAMLAAAAGKPFEIGFSGRMQFQWASDVALQFISCAERPVPGAFVYNPDTPSASVEEIVGYIREAVPEAEVRVKETRLPFPEGLDGRMLRESGLYVAETSLREGVRRTIEQFRGCLADGRIAV